MDVDEMDTALLVFIAFTASCFALFAGCFLTVIVMACIYACKPRGKKEKRIGYIFIIEPDHTIQLGLGEIL